jgi:hypothetical protein
MLVRPSSWFARHQALIYLKISACGRQWYMGSPKVDSVIKVWQATGSKGAQVASASIL